MPSDTRSWLKLLGSLSFLALASAYALQYLGGFLPCQLCYWQRYPYMAVILVAALGLAAGYTGRPSPFRACSFSSVPGSPPITSASSRASSPCPPAASRSAPPPPSRSCAPQLASAAPACDQVSVMFLGLSLSAWNGLTAWRWRLQAFLP
jgi:disulfide bond formation protein DsbB